MEEDREEDEDEEKIELDYQRRLANLFILESKKQTFPTALYKCPVLGMTFRYNLWMDYKCQCVYSSIKPVSSEKCGFEHHVDIVCVINECYENQHKPQPTSLE